MGQGLQALWRLFFIKCQEIARKESLGKFWDRSFWFLEELNVHPKYQWWGVTSVSFSVGVVLFPVNHRWRRLPWSYPPKKTNMTMENVAWMKMCFLFSSQSWSVYFSFQPWRGKATPGENHRQHPGVRRGTKVPSGLGECRGDVGGCHLASLGTEGAGCRFVCFVGFVWFVGVGG